MNNLSKLEKIALGVGIAILALGAIAFSRSEVKLGGVIVGPSFGTASSSVISVGASAHTTILQAKGGRAYASICNNGANKGYIYLMSTTSVSTTTASVPLPAAACYVINRDNLYTGVVGYVSETSTTTHLFVTELLGY